MKKTLRVNRPLISKFSWIELLVVSGTHCVCTLLNVHVTKVILARKLGWPFRGCFFAPNVDESVNIFDLNDQTFWRSHLQRRISIVVASSNQRRRFSPVAINRRHLSVYFTTSVSSFHFHSVCVYHWHNLHTKSRGITSKLLTVWKRIEVQQKLKVCSYLTFAFASTFCFVYTWRLSLYQRQCLALHHWWHRPKHRDWVWNHSLSQRLHWYWHNVNFDGDVNANVKCEQAFKYCVNHWQWCVYITIEICGWRDREIANVRCEQGLKPTILHFGK